MCGRVGAWTIVVALVGGCGCGETGFDAAACGSELALRGDGWCGAVPASPETGVAFEIQGRRLPSHRAALLTLDDAAGARTFRIATDAEGSFTLSTVVTTAGDARARVQLLGGNRALVASCEFVVTAPAPVDTCSYGVCAPVELGCVGWEHGDVGAAALPGSLTCDAQMMRLTASGADIWGGADAMHFAYQSLTGDGAIVGRVAALTETHPWAKAGVMMRSHLGASSPHAHVLVSAAPTTPVKLDHRLSEAATTAGTPGTLTAAPYWVRLERHGDTLRGFESADGISWRLLGEQRVVLGINVYVGLTLTSHDDSLLAEAVFDHVEVQLGGVAACLSDSACDDQDPCTTDRCIAGACESAGSCELSCGDGLCTGLETCDNCSVDCGACCATGRPRVFPGAEGFGTCTQAGRGGALLRVTSLADNGPGTLREALSATGPRTIVFEVGGSITLSNPIAVRNPYVTVAGQTAPEPGIQVRNNGISIETHDVLIQHLRVRNGGESPSYFEDSISVGYSASNVVLDHVTANWGKDENMEIWAAVAGTGIHDVTVSNSIIAEGVNNKYGLLIGTNDTSDPDKLANLSILRNLFAHNIERSPLVNSNTTAVIANNLGYNAGRAFTAIVDLQGPSRLSIQGNHYIAGPSAMGDAALTLLNAAQPGGAYYVDDCIITGANPPPLLGYPLVNRLASATPVVDPSALVTPVADVRASVLARAGARPAFRDSVERRIVSDVVSGTGSFKSSVAAAGGWPTDYAAATLRAFAAPVSPAGDDDGDGYTNLEELLHRMAAAVEGRE